MISWTQCGPEGGREARVGMQGSIRPGRFLEGRGAITSSQYGPDKSCLPLLEPGRTLTRRQLAHQVRADWRFPRLRGFKQKLSSNSGNLSAISSIRQYRPSPLLVAGSFRRASASPTTRGINPAPLTPECPQGSIRPQQASRRHRPFVSRYTVWQASPPRNW